VKNIVAEREAGGFQTDSKRFKFSRRSYVSCVTNVRELRTSGESSPVEEAKEDSARDFFNDRDEREEAEVVEIQEGVMLGRTRISLCFVSEENRGTWHAGGRRRVGMKDDAARDAEDEEANIEES
jgi:hypothetical protein